MQQISVTGTVVDENGEPMAGVNIIVKGTTLGTFTDANGKYTLSVPNADAVLEFTFIGYETKTIPVNNQKTISVKMEPSSLELEEVVVTAFGATQKKETMVGAVQQIRPSELKIPSASLSSSFAGRMAGVIAVQRSGQPGADGANFWIRGVSTFSGVVNPLIVLDGVEISSSELNALDPEVIDGFSILKDATATAMYGTRGANGVMIITTKKGNDLLKPIINFRAESSCSVLTKIPKMVDGVDYMKLYNEALMTRGFDTGLYPEEKIRATEQGLNPLVYPNVDWYSEMFNRSTFAQRFNFNIRGGKKAVTYFMSASLKHDDGNLKPMSKDYFSYNNNINVMRYDFVNNLEIKATNTTKVSLGLNVNLRDWKGPAQDPNTIFSLSREASPVDFPIVFPARDQKEFYALWGGMSGGSLRNQGYYNPIAEYVIGYKKMFRSTVNANLRLEQDLKILTKGLKAHVLVSFKNNSISEVNRNANYNTFEIDPGSYNPETEEFTLNRVGDELNTALNTTGKAEGNRRFFLQAYLDYNRKFGAHDVNAMLLYNQDQFENNKPDNLLVSLPQRKQGVAARFSYSYGNRYMAEFNFGYNGSENFAKKHRYGFFPSIAVGYTISREKFYAPLSRIIPHLKLRASYGLVGNDGISERFAYLEDIVLASGQWKYVTGVKQNVALQGPFWNRFYNPDLTWEVGRKLNVGLDLEVLKQLSMNIDVFKEVRSNIYTRKTQTVPKFVGSGDTKIFDNSGKMKNVGFDISADYNNQLTKDLFISFKGTLTYAHNTILKQDEPPFRFYPNKSAIGHSMGEHLVYLADGLFKDQAEIDAHAEQTLGYVPQPGDIKYVDIPDVNGNCDGIINDNDKVYKGYPQRPEIVYGFGPSMKYKEWDFSFFFQGCGRTSLLMSGFHPFGQRQIRGVMQFIADDYWSESNPNPKAAYPRLTREDNKNNIVASSYWLRNGSFLKLKNAEIGYSYKMFRAYLSGLNLLTFSSFKHWDPEMGGGSGMSYPTQRVFNIGIQFTFK